MHAKVEARSVVRDEQRCHLRLVHADADPVAGDARLRHFEQRTPDPVAIADAHLVVGQPVDGEILAELSKAQVAAVELRLPIAIGADLIDKDGALLAAMSSQIALTVTVDVETPHHAPALDGRLPDAGVDRPASPFDIARQTHVDRKQTSHRLLLPASEKAGFPAFPSQQSHGDDRVNGDPSRTDTTAGFKHLDWLTSLSGLIGPQRVFSVLAHPV